MRRVLLVSVVGLVTSCLAQTADNTGAFFIWTDSVSIMALAIAVVACALAQGNAINKAVEGIARQPEAAGRIQPLLLVGLGFIESLTIYVLVVALILIFANPATSHFLR
jgi:F-type H+-transporting ATPase subunit c